MKKIIFFILIFSLHFQSFSANKKIKLCLNDTELIPFVIFENNEILGVRVDIIKKIIRNLNGKLNMELSVEAMPWTRCLKMAENGEIDAPIDVSYNDERAQYLDFPPDAGPNEKKSCDSKLKLACSGYFVISLKSNKFVYHGKASELPTPVRVTRGYSVVTELEKIFPNNLVISKSDLINVNSLISEKNGSVVAYFGSKPQIENNKDILNQIKIHKINFSSKSYFIPFSKKSKFTDKEKLIFWKELNKVTSNKTFMDSIYSKYNSYISKMK